MARLRFASAVILLAACGASPPAGRPCASHDECAAGEACVDGRCVPRVDAGGSDAGGGACAPSRACGSECCSEAELCGTNARCCAAEDLCGGACCEGAGRTCVADVCVLDCGGSAACGEGDDAVCCGSDQVCLLGECVDPGAPCAGPFDCGSGEYCEASLGRCLPRATGQPECEYRPMMGDFELQEEWHWSGDPDVMPDYDQVMSAPMVANLNDDNGDGVIDENDIPDVVFNTFHRNSPNRGSASTYNVDGVLRAISGHDGSRLWPTTTPPYRTHPSLEVAIADIRADSPGPEIVGCTFDPGTATANPRLTIFSATGDILHRFDEASGLSVPCGRPAVADMNGDGVAEIAIGNRIVQSDGSGMVEVPLNSTASIVVLYDVDSDPDLELVGINGVADHDGTVLWNDSMWAGHSGYVAVADMDLDGDPDVVATSTTAHQVTVRDAATGALLAGPVEVTPLDDPAIAARVAAEMAARPDRDALTGGGPPTIANFDDDPEPEFALAGGYAYVIFEHDATRKWYFETQDTSSRATGSSVFDFEGDGRAEVVYGDECFLRVYDGRTGEVVFSQSRSSCTWYENPVIADLDGDFNAEIVIGSNYNCGSAASGVDCSGFGLGPRRTDPLFAGLRCAEPSDCLSGVCDAGFCRCTSDDQCCAGAGCERAAFVCEAPPAGTPGSGNTCRASRPMGTLGIRVYRDAADRWVRSRMIWNQHAYHVTNVEEDGTIPRLGAARLNWLEPGLNNFRQNVQGEGHPEQAPDLTSRGASPLTCAADGTGTLSAQVCNRGTEPVGSDVSVGFYDGDPRAGGTRICQARTRGVLDPGACETVSCPWATPPTGAPGIALWVVADDESDTGECYEGNNATVFEGVYCPTIE